MEKCKLCGDEIKRGWVCEACDKNITEDDIELLPISIGDNVSISWSKKQRMCGKLMGFMDGLAIVRLDTHPFSRVYIGISSLALPSD